MSWSRNQNVAELERLNPLGTVSTLLLDDGSVITQNVAGARDQLDGIRRRRIA